jgi:hypothetical protein
MNKHKTTELRYYSVGIILTDCWVLFGSLVDTHGAHDQILGCLSPFLMALFSQIYLSNEMPSIDIDFGQLILIRTRLQSGL